MILDQSIGIALVAIGVILFAVELIHPGALLLIPSSIFLAVGVIILLGSESLLYSPYGPAIVLAAGAAAAIATVPYYRYVAPVGRPMATIPSSLEGELGVVTAPVVPDTLRGKVRVKSETWSARSDRPIPAGTRVRILGGEGVSLLVEPVGEAGRPAEGS